ncbi:hypothetical protein BJ980_002288 [Nocardioides daedukensis]|uniref:Uncharacterized protein n=1 Tax=Nocardioides daedukensis TaxID=634462 RepID=A0A7Y9RZY3_9ACTN|nr:hypothetical protein [Nocardioides daedukensis]NYG59365.1 hypothetical protein [Nocardioides daedukensis]
MENEAGEGARVRPERKSMTPLQKMGMGLVVVALDTLGGEGIGAWDLLPDFIGWAMVAWGIVSLGNPQRTQLLCLAALAAVVSLVFWFPSMQTQLRDAELALKWAASLPDLAFVIATAIAFKAAARAAGDRKFYARFGLTLWFAVIVAALPAIASAADSQAMLDYAELGFVLLWLWLIWNLFAAHARPWAADRD